VRPLTFSLGNANHQAPSNVRVERREQESEATLASVRFSNALLYGFDFY
jgi:hypothetical protein